MSVQNQISRGVPLNGGDYRRLVKMVDVATQLGAPDAILEVWPYGVYLFAADDLVSPVWWFGSAFRWRSRRTKSYHALIAPPTAIMNALNRAGGYHIRVKFGKDRVRFLGPDGAVEVPGRVVPLRDGDAIPVSAHNHGSIFAIVQFDLEPLRSAVSDAGAHGILELHLVRSLGADPNWEAYVVNEGGERVPLQVKAVMEPERDIVGRYRAATLNAMLSLRTQKYLGLMFTGSPESPTLYADWRELDIGVDVEFLMRPLS